MKDGFQQGQVLVSISWVLVGLGLVVASLRGGNRPLRAAAIALLFVALGKLFLYDLAFLTAMARAVSFIFTGVVLLVAALLSCSAECGRRYAVRILAVAAPVTPVPWLFAISLPGRVGRVDDRELQRPVTHDVDLQEPAAAGREVRKLQPGLLRGVAGRGGLRARRRRAEADHRAGDPG